MFPILEFTLAESNQPITVNVIMLVWFRKRKTTGTDQTVIKLFGEDDTIYLAESYEMVKEKIRNGR